MCPGHFLHLSEHKAEKTDPDKYKIDGSFIAVEYRDRVIPRIPNWALQVMGAEWKRGGTKNEPFNDVPTHDPNAERKSRKNVRGQVMSYNERAFAYQHRTAMHHLFINGEWFRAMRWDRGGVIATEAINYVSNPAGTKALLEVLYAFSQLTMEERGYDLTAVPLLEDSCGWQRMDALAEDCDDDLDHEFEGPIERFIHPIFINPSDPLPAHELSSSDDRLHLDPTCVCEHHSSHSLPPVIPVWGFLRRKYRDTLVEGFPRYRLRICGEDYLIAREIFLGFGMVGRGTRGYIALEWRTQRLVFLKDAWRPFYDKVQAEGEILSILNAHNVPYIPQLIRYEDVRYENGDPQETETSNYSPLTGSKEVQISDPFLPIGTWDEEQLPQASEDDIKAAVALLRKLPATTQLERVGRAPRAAKNKRAAASDPNRRLAIVAPPRKPDQHSEPRGKKRSADEVQTEDRRLQGTGLRHLVHTRTVVRDVCLPFTDFTSSKQLVQIILQCIAGSSSPLMLSMLFA